MAHVTVDEELCVGTGDCARLVPGAFVVDEERNVSIVQPAAGTAPLDRLLVAARNCPTNAIRIVADDGDVLYESA